MCVGRVVGPGIGSLAQHPGLVIVSNKPPPAWKLVVVAC